MNIQEAAKKAEHENKLMTRDCYFQDCGEGCGAIDPTNGYDCCRVMKKTSSGWIQRERCWNPTLEDLTADDWSLITKE